MMLSSMRCLRIQTELHSYPDAASSDGPDDETDNIFGYMKRRCCEISSFFIS
jgi:hypothetical protein